MRNLRGFSIGNRGKEQGFAIYEVGFVGNRSNFDNTSGSTCVRQPYAQNVFDYMKS